MNLAPRKFVRVALLISLTAAPGLAQSGRVPGLLTWSELPPLPRAVAGHFAGTVDNRLLVAGGTNFPVSLFAGGKKAWYKDVFQFNLADSLWQKSDTLTGPLAYGASVSTPQGLVLIGGSDGTRHFRSVQLFRFAERGLARTRLPALPHPAAFLGAAYLDGKIYAAGGQTAPTATRALRTFWVLDLNDSTAGWQELPPWPGPGRILPVVVAQAGAVYVLSGADLRPDSTGASTREYLRDGYRYTPGSGWSRIADLPYPVVAAPAAAYGTNHILVFGGDDGKLASRLWELRDQHPGFHREVLAYHTITNTWAVVDTLPIGLVTTNAVLWQGNTVIPGGEDRPGHRSRRVLLAQPRAVPRHLGALDYSILGIYFLGLILMGFYFSGREKSTGDFFLAGRRIPWWAAGLSIFGTQLSAITYMAVPAKSYATDWVFYLSPVCIVLIAPVLVRYYLPIFRRFNITTAYEYLEIRFNLAVRVFGSLAFLLFQLGRVAIVLYLPAIALSTVAGIDVITSILMMGLIALAYTVLGGIEAVIWTDVLQVIVLVGGAVLSLAVVVARIDGGVPELFRTASADGKFHMFNWTWDATVASVWVVLLGNLFAQLAPYSTDQAVIQRYLTTPDERQAAKSIWMNALMSPISSALFFLLGTALYVFYKHHPQFLHPGLQTDAIFPWFIVQQLPAGISGLLIAGLFAASMSSLDSSMNSVAAVVVTDYYRRFHRNVTENAALRLARWVTVAVGLFGTATAVVLASVPIASLWDVFLRLLSFLGGALSGVFLLGVFTKRANGPGTLVGAFAAVVVLAWAQSYTHVHFFLHAAIGSVTCVVVGYLASLAFGERR